VYVPGWLGLLCLGLIVWCGGRSCEHEGAWGLCEDLVRLDVVYVPETAGAEGGERGPFACRCFCNRAEHVRCASFLKVTLLTSVLPMIDTCIEVASLG
jgi:hypothetical protein